MRVTVGSHFVQLIFEKDVLGAVAAIVVREAAASHMHVLAHVDAPRVVGVAGEQSVVTDLDTAGLDVPVMIAVVPAVRVLTHLSLW